MPIDQCPSEEEYDDNDDLINLEQLKIDIQKAWKVYDDLQTVYAKETGKQYQWFK